MTHKHTSRDFASRRGRVDDLLYIGEAYNYRILNKSDMLMACGYYN